MGCPRHKKSKPKDKFTRFDDVKGPIFVSKDIKSTEFYYDQLVSGKLLDMAGISRNLSKWCLEQDYANEIIKHVSISAAGTSSGHIPAGNTYLGQLVTHDLLGETLDSYPTNHRFPIDGDKLTGKSEPTQVLNQFNLDTLYPSSFEYALEHDYIDESGSFKLDNVNSCLSDTSDEQIEKQLDLHRPDILNGWPVIADRRNAENVILAQLVVFFLRLHNQAIAVCSQEKNHKPKESYERARKFVTLVYQYLIRDEFLFLILRNAPCLIENGLPQKFINNFSSMNEIPLEFSGAIFRMGHSMVRETYNLRLHGEAKGVDFVGELLSSDKRIDDDVLIDWQMFFDHGEKAKGFNHAGSIDLAIVTADSVSGDSSRSNIGSKHGLQGGGNTPSAEEHLLNMQMLVKLDLQACQGLPSGGQLIDIFYKLSLKPEYKNVFKAIGLEDFAVYRESILCVLREYDYLGNISVENLPLNIFVLVEAHAMYSRDDKRLGPIATLFVLLVYQITLDKTSVNIAMDESELKNELGEKLFCLLSKLKDKDNLYFKSVNNYLNK